MTQHKTTKTISELGSECMTTLDELVEKLSRPMKDDRYVLADDFRGRFRIWAANIGALKPPAYPNSLDSRVRKAQQMKSSIVFDIERIIGSGNAASRILDGDVPNRQRYVKRNGRSKIDTDELLELLLNVKSAVDHLFELSIILRRHRPQGSKPKIGVQPSVDSQDITNVGDKFPKVKGNTWLLQRLGNAVSQRRNFIQYRQNHRPGLPVDKGKEIRDATISKATTFLDPADLLPSMEALSIHTSATSFASSFGTDDYTQTLRVPTLTNMVLDGVPLRYGEKFECPYCRTICEVKTRYEWKKHVFSDLQPYVCTYENCERSSHLFETRSAWSQHERDIHHRRWSCILCDRPGSFRSREQIEKHFLTNHRGKVTPSQLPLLLEACGQLREDEVSSCALCTEWVSKPAMSSDHEPYSRHLARHLQQIALASFPIYIEGLEIRDTAGLDEASSDEESLLIGDDAAINERNCEECQFRWIGKSFLPEQCPRCHAKPEGKGRIDAGEEAAVIQQREATTPSQQPGELVTTERSESQTLYNWVWYCSNCSTGPLNASADPACPQRQHWRCRWCSMQQVAMPADR